MNDPQNHVRSLAQLHDHIEKNPSSGATEAAQTITAEIKAVAGKITDDAEKTINQLHADAQSAAVKLSQEADRTVERIKKDTATIAADILNESKNDGFTPREKALAATKILKIAEKTTEQLNLMSEKSVRKISEQAETAAFMVKRVADSANRDLAVVERDAIKRISDAGKDAASKFPGSTDNGGLDEAALKEAQLAAADVIKNLAQAADAVNQASKKATSQLQEASEEAAISVKKAAARAAKLVHMSIDDANEKILEVTSEAIKTTVGEEKAEFFDLDPLKKRWGKSKE
ncbi:MAG: hypothetical protein HQ512_00185 [Rhodospirillales bacterium]|nr:hypothetical protein [Rhodospirillales bacterium]